MFLLIALACPLPLVQQQSLAERIGVEAAAFLDATEAPGVVIGFLEANRQWSRGFGGLIRGGDSCPDGRTVYEIGSITKVFTGILLAEAVGRGEVTLDTPLAELLPAGTELATGEKGPILLRHLVTHTSALPRVPSVRPKDVRNPFASLTEEVVLADLARIDLSTEPGAKYAYSNLAFGLLGHGLGQRAGVEWSILIADRITGPLGMKDTAPRCTEDMTRRLAPPWGADGRRRWSWDFDCLAGCGALRSTVDDVLLFAKAQLAAWEQEGSATARARTVLHRFNDKGDGVAYGWHVRDGGKTWWHNGGTGGYRSYLALVPGHRRAVVVLSNTTSGKVDDLAHAILRLLGSGT